MARPLSRRPPARIRILEVGAGTGVFTREILRQMRSGDSLSIYEINPEFCAYLERMLAAENWRQRNLAVELRRADIRDLPAELSFDYIISGLPLNNFAPLEVAGILKLLIDHLHEDGVFSYFEYLGMRDVREWFIRSGPEHERLHAIGEIMREVLSRYQFRSDEVWLNLPPASAHHLSRRRVAALSQA